MSEIIPRSRQRINETTEWVSIPKPDKELEPEAAPLDVESPTTNTEHSATQQEIDQQPDVELRYKDVEVLGRRYPVQRVVKELGNQRLIAVETMSASWKNTLDTPGKYRLKLAQSLAESRHSRQQSRLDAVSHLPDNHFLKRRRTAKLERAKVKLDLKRSAYNDKVGQMTERRQNIPRNAAERREAYIGELARRREAALARREVRRNLRQQGAGMLEARSITKDIPKDHLDRVGKIAGQTRLTRKQLRGANRYEQRVGDKSVRLANEITSSTNKINQHNRNVLVAESKLSNIKNVAIPDTEANIGSLTSELEDLDADSPDREALRVKIDEQQHKINISEREIAHWESVVASNKAAMHHLASKREAATAERIDNRKLESNAASITDDHDQTNNLYENQLNNSIETTLNNEKEKQ